MQAYAVREHCWHMRLWVCVGRRSTETLSSILANIPSVVCSMLKNCVLRTLLFSWDDHLKLRRWAPKTHTVASLNGDLSWQLPAVGGDNASCIAMPPLLNGVVMECGGKQKLWVVDHSARVSRKSKANFVIYCELQNALIIYLLNAHCGYWLYSSPVCLRVGWYIYRHVCEWRLVGTSWFSCHLSRAVFGDSLRCGVLCALSFQSVCFCCGRIDRMMCAMHCEACNKRYASWMSSDCYVSIHVQFLQSMVAVKLYVACSAEHGGCWQG